MSYIARSGANKVQGKSPKFLEMAINSYTIFLI